MKLITELTNEINYITEATESGEKKLYIEGPFIVTEVVNKNNRMYKMDYIRDEVNRYINEQVNQNAALGELNHPNTPTVNPERAAIKIISLKEDKNVFIGKAKVLTEFPCGNILGKMIKENIRVGVSSRGTGDLKRLNEGYDVVMNNYKLATAADIVHNPSGLNCYVNGILEGAEWLYDESTNGWISVELANKHKKYLKENYKQLDESTKLNMFNNFLASLKNGIN